MLSRLQRSIFRIILAALFVCPVSTRAASVADQVFAPPAPQELRSEIDRWLEQRRLNHSPIPDAIAPLWTFEEPPRADELFDALLRTYYIADEDVRNLVEACRSWSFSPDLLHVQLNDAARAHHEPLLINNARYFLARHLTLLNAYSEANEIFQEIELRYVVDPAGCLFHRAVCEHHLLLKKEGLGSLTLLLNQTEKVPLRYRQLGELMQRDLNELKEKTLGEVARQMKDAENRLNLNQADEGLLDVEARIIATLDELIKKMEDQQQQQNSSGGGAGAAGDAPSNPANQSYLGGVRGKGETEKKELGHKDRWGDLPPKEREAAKNMLDQQFPAHYRQAVEEYLKKLAERPAP
ncbi:hypothetical protein [Planctomicrobium sp. SH664]|uniref:hypothetical protein n=1 Tax=Planctomicrobium sp. SH664 TaxID=3448125 RepID=UPI003F5C7013